MTDVVKAADVPPHFYRSQELVLREMYVALQRADAELRRRQREFASGITWDVITTVRDAISRYQRL